MNVDDKVVYKPVTPQHNPSELKYLPSSSKDITESAEIFQPSFKSTVNEGSCQSGVTDDSMCSNEYWTILSENNSSKSKSNVSTFIPPETFGVGANKNVICF